MRRVAVFTGTRADYGLVRGLARAVHDDARLELQLIVSGAHLTGDQARSFDEIEADGLPVAATVPVWSGDDSALGAAADTGAAVSAYARTLDGLRPDVVVVLGDRLEALALALAATVLGIPVAHIHGGEVTEGAMDDALRHAITKLSYLHFTTTAEHRDRVMQLGEDGARVFALGAPVLDAIAEYDLLDEQQLLSVSGVTVDRSTVVVTFHPAAFDRVPSPELLHNLLAALAGLEGAKVVITGTNTDIGSDALRAAIAAFVASHESASFVESFGQLGYLSAMGLAGAVAGNSSSVVLEAPLLGVPSVLIGDRQQGRPLAASVLTPESDSASIRAALERALSASFRSEAAAQPGIFGEPGFAARAVAVLASTPLPAPPRKTFADHPVRTTP